MGKNKGKAGADAPAASAASVPTPPYIPQRIELFDQLKARHEAKMEALRNAATPIKVTLPDGSVKEGVAHVTTPYDIAKSIAAGLAKSAVVAKCDGEFHDLHRPLERDCELELFKFDSAEGKHAFWHSSAHILGQALEMMYGGHLGIGPALESGFYYDIFTPDAIPESEWPKIETFVNKIIKENQPFERIPLTKSEALEMFKYNKYKVEIISKDIPEDATVTVYRCGNLVDLCRGPHVPETGRVKAFSLLKGSSAYWKGSADNDVMKRLYGVSFPDKKQLNQYKQFLEEAAKRDHRKIGIDQELFFFNNISPGCCFFLPKGAVIYNKLVSFIRDIYRRRGFQEVVTPNIFNVKLWQTSGHWQNYAENMFSFEVEKELYALKPMNCPGHCVLFDHRTRSHRELPMRIADFGVLHRNELSGTLSGLTRVRRFQQDDAHIFCTPEQIEEEIKGSLSFLEEVYGVFGFTFELELSTRPVKYLGDIAVWDEAEMALANALSDFGHPWKLNPEDGAFYGPKIDITIMDALRRKHQCATIQLDFQLPLRFGLKYVGGDEGSSQPVIIHRAMLGSVERFIAIITENYAGKWPFWLSPRQAMVIPVSPEAYPYARRVEKTLFDAGFHVESDCGPNKFPKKVAVAQADQFNYMLIVGVKEEETNSVNVRLRGEKAARGMLTLDELVAEFKQLEAEHK